MNSVVSFRLLLIAVTLTASAGAQATKSGTSTPMVRFVEEVWNQGKYEVIPEVVAPDAEWHYVGRTFGGIESVVKRWRTGFPDFHFTIEDLLVDGDKVAARLTFTGTQQGPFFGQGPTGKPIKVTQTVICTVEKERLKVCWEDWDELGMRQQLGLIPSYR